MSKLQKAVEDFCGFLLTEKGASGNTITAYRNDLGQLADFMETRSITDGWKGLDSSSLQDFIVDLKTHGYTESSIARKVAAIRSFFGFLASEGALTNNPAEALASPHINRAVPTTLTPVEVDELLEQPARRSTPEAKRDRAMLELIYATGMRVTELVSLNVTNLNLDPRFPYVKCMGKGAKERSITIHDQALEALNAYLEDGRPMLLRDPSELALFLNRRGERLTRQGFWFILKGYARSANLSEEITPHTLRHSFAAHMVRGGMTLKGVQEMLGYTNTSRIQAYVRAGLTDEVRQAYIQAHPRA
ncbi:MAG: hypothetical protein A2Z11_00275 [Candidatus Woykebacteria bacterium RBG_16_43_9]|uniref:Tyrosine recombinase XerC n=1 Tax=Candidatus Woykebacteria bacterium RBG_16_43_9 TaxID=1802596 RepID=A0A1G1WG86_9BACT|nr:MAG: hypothetical protein A2Z11_00275 [Candidatus Woykebacteria bacterium RBG_16_43_9]